MPEILAFRAEQRATAEAERANVEADRANAEAERANAEADRANANLTIARDTVYNVARDVAQGVRDVQGMRIENLRAILQRVETAIADLLKAAPDDEQVLRGRATTLTLFSDTYLAAGRYRRGPDRPRRGARPSGGACSRPIPTTSS